MTNFATKTRTMQDLPKSIIIPREAHDIESALRTASETLNNSVSTLHHLPELSPLPEALEDVNEGWLDALLSKRTKAIHNDESLTEFDRSNRLQSWSQIKSKALPYVRTIATILRAWKDARWQMQGTCYVCANAEDIITARATHKVPDEAQEHWRRIHTAIDAVRNLRTWEDAHNIKSQLLGVMNDMLPTIFVESWVNGDMQFDQRFAHLGIKPQNFHNPNKPNWILF